MDSSHASKASDKLGLNKFFKLLLCRPGFKNADDFILDLSSFFSGLFIAILLFGSLTLVFECWVNNNAGGNLKVAITPLYFI
jgi:hypothetical protein